MRLVWCRPFPISKTLLLVLSAQLLLADEPIDWQRARELYQKSRRGGVLTAEEQSYVERARKARAAIRRGQAGAGENDAGSADKPSRHFTPLDELGQERYLGEKGGLYGSGKNDPPAELQAAARTETEKIEPLDAEGKPSAVGKIVLLSIGMSNTTQEFSQFKRQADGLPEKSPPLVIVDGAQGGQDAVRTADESAPFWDKIDERLKAARVTAQQVQVAWLKQAIARPTAGFPAESKRLQELLVQIVNIAKGRYPNLRICYLSSRTYAGYAQTALNPEPYAYESAFAVRGVILDQMKGTPELNWDPEHGKVRAPLLLWGPYLWTDGTQPRKRDGLVWTREDVGADGTHPNLAGRRKVADQLLHFFKSDPNARYWFLKK